MRDTPGDQSFGAVTSQWTVVKVVVVVLPIVPRSRIFFWSGIRPLGKELAEMRQS
jgi:hypothetical protein